MKRPWYRKLDGWWYLTHGGKQIKLSRNKQEAHDKWIAFSAASANCFTTLEVCDKYMAHIQANSTPRNYDHCKRYLKRFLIDNRHIPASELKAHHLSESAEKQKAPSAKRAVIVVTKACFRWASEQELIDRNPFLSVKATRCGRRELVLDNGTIQAMLLAASPRFRMYLQFLRHTGARPQEIRMITLANYQESKQSIVLSSEQNKTGKRTGKARVIPLTPCMQTLLRIIKASSKSGEVFRSPSGEPWNRNSVKLSFKRLRKLVDFPKGTSAYTLRHTFITNALVNGVDIATVAAIAGHSSTAMIDRHYGHLAEQSEHLASAMTKAVSTLKNP